MGYSEEGEYSDDMSRKPYLRRGERVKGSNMNKEMNRIHGTGIKSSLGHDNTENTICSASDCTSITPSLTIKLPFQDHGNPEGLVPRPILRPSTNFALYQLNYNCLKRSTLTKVKFENNESNENISLGSGQKNLGLDMNHSDKSIFKTEINANEDRMIKS
jgi:hypothetical protein